MKKLIILFLLMSNSAHAGVPDYDVELARRYVSFEMDVHPLPEPLINTDMGDFVRLITPVDLNGLNGRGVMGAYQLGRIYLPRYYSEDLPLLVHEMVHHAQTIGARKYECTNAKEREAYQLQNSFAIKFGYSMRVPIEQIEALTCGSN
jgi:hypothetical protein